MTDPDIIKYTDLRLIDLVAHSEFQIFGTADDGQEVLIVKFPYDFFDGGKRWRTATIMANNVLKALKE